MSKIFLGAQLTYQVWEELKSGRVPLLSDEDLSSIPQFVEAYTARLRSRSYLPDVAHGYLGVEKGVGVTRFLPILSKEDMAIYYHLCTLIGEKVIIKRERIFGGWRAITTSGMPNNSEEAEREAKAFQQGYFSGAFSNVMWFDAFRSFTQLVKNLISDSTLGPYVATTDISNFYDSIEIPRLIQKLRRDMPKEHHEEISFLEIFLGLWNRRITGYTQSSTGIPQEIISDGSRFLSHYYLQDFDAKFSDYCASKSLVYVRFADDMLIFGRSKQRIEEAVHEISRLLLTEGLNLNSHKTKIYTKSELSDLRVIELLDAISRRDNKKVRKELRSIRARISEGKPLRLDTAFRAVLGYLHRMGGRAGVYERNFAIEVAFENPSIVGTLNDLQLFNLISISNDRQAMFRQIRGQCLSRPYTGPVSNFLMLIRTHGPKLEAIGISKRLQRASVSKIEREERSEVIGRYCLPATKRALEG
ncbi:RNA-directed DNA polymerase [Marivivens sp. LCG002]|uniref:RNA-directed DNA polymerase n=1 Tax=Marivivens sp. LCG002 TaxID=3051171 RepID=UPI0025564393|nr:RNA-directed DNA polymerase [Marivivens sp. LCG002]WIV49968.1 RNA-directed DNA polymerase [Marivivens sp. LCG002]